MRFSDLPSATPLAPLRTANRLDPYWDGVWQFGSHAQWVSREHFERIEAAGLAATRPVGLRTTPAAAAARLDRDWDTKLDLLGVLSSWRTVTAEQASAFAGSSVPASVNTRVFGDLFALDLIDVGSLGATSNGPASARARMFRPSASKAFRRLIHPRMTYAEWVSVTGGLKYLTGGQYDRHNVLTAELALRAAEFLRIGSVLGERQAHVNTIAYTGTGLPEPPGRSQQTADAVIIRPDGVRVAVETTASVGSDGFTRKAEMWARLLSRRSFDETGLVVVFVVADRTVAEAGEHGRASLLGMVRKKVARAARLHPGTASHRTADRMFVVGWQDWFPARGEASEDFLTLRAQRAVGLNNAWEVADILDEFDVPTPTRMTDPEAVLRSSSGLRSVPAHLRSQVRPDLHRLPLQRAGFEHAPHIHVDKVTGAVRSDPTRARGGAGPIGAPARLRF